jgi:hypothetical protein
MAADEAGSAEHRDAARHYRPPFGIIFAPEPQAMARFGVIT